MASKPKAALKTATKAVAKAVDENLSAKDLHEKTDFMENHVGHAKPLLADAVINHMGGWNFFSLCAHDASECGIDLGFNGFSKENECKAFFVEHKKLLKDFYKPKTAKAKKAAELLRELGESKVHPFSDDEISEVFGSKAKIVVEEVQDSTADGDDYDEVGAEPKKVAIPIKQDVDITVWLARNAAQYMVDAYSHMDPSRYEAGILVETPEQQNDDETQLIDSEDDYDDFDSSELAENE